MNNKDIYKSKYIKYKNKYLKLKEQYGGNLFEQLFPYLINYIIEFNKTDGGSLFSPNRFLHVKGGASIKYHIMKNQVPIDTTNITSDIDLFLVCDEEEVNQHIESFLSGLKTHFSQYNWTHKIDGALLTILVNGIDIIDLTVFSSSYSEPDPETSMFSYALANTGFANIEDYFDKLNLIDHQDMLQSYELVERKTFTSLLFEKFACMKGIENQRHYLESKPNWEKLARYYLAKASDESLPMTERERYYNTYQRYLYQLSPEYISKLENKLLRYQQKLEVINQMLARK
jgi:hypothetical protein